jgi:hypothetical protein
VPVELADIDGRAGAATGAPRARRQITGRTDDEYDGALIAIDRFPSIQAYMFAFTDMPRPHMPPEKAAANPENETHERLFFIGLITHGR